MSLKKFKNFLEKNTTYKKIFIFMVIFLAIISVARAVQQAQIYSYDFSVSTAKLVSEGINNYEYVLEGKHDKSESDRILYSQDGLYAHGFHVLLIPFAKMSWKNAKLIWSMINVTLAFLIPILLCKKFNFSRNETIFLTSILLMSTVLRINIAYGQHTLFTFFFLILPFIYQSKLSYFLSGFSYFKYNIGYGLFLYLASLKSINKIIISLIPVIIGWLVFSFMTNTDLLKSLFQPFLTTIYYHDQGDHLPVTIFSILRLVNIKGFFLLIFPFVINIFIIYKASLLKDNLLKLSLICLSILAFTPHQIHDYILLFPLFLYSFKNLDLVNSKFNIIFILYFFFGLRIISFFFSIEPWEFPYGTFGYINNLLTLVILFINFINLKKTNQYEK